jgi:hypothetical protein
MLELGYAVFYSQLLALQVGNDVEVGQGSVDFLIESGFEALMLSTKLFDTVLRRHGTSCCDHQMRHEALMVTPFGAGRQAGYAAAR